MCWTDFVAYKEGRKEGDEDSNNTQDGGGGGSETMSTPMVALNDRALLITPGRAETRPERLERHDQVMALTCLDNDPPLTRRRHPMTIMRTMSERSLDRGRSGLLNLLSERYHHSDRASIRAFNKASVLGGLKSSALNTNTTITTTPTTPTTMTTTTASTTTSATTTTTTSTTTTDPTSDCTTGMESVERALEAARENVRASMNKTETKRREAVWDLFQSECAFLYDHLMVLKNVSIERRGAL